MSHRECQVCLESYNCEDRRPHSLMCGHTICSQCLEGLHEKRHLLCPLCRAPHKVQVNSVNDVPVNYALLSLLQDRSRETLCHDDMSRSLKQETKYKNLIKIAALEDQIKLLRSCLTDLKSQAAVNVKVTKYLAELAKYLEKHKKLEQVEINSIEEALKDALVVAQHLKDSQKSVNETNTLKEAVIAQEKANILLENVEPFLHRNQVLISRKVLKMSQKILSECESFLVRVKSQMAQPEPASLPVRPQTTLLKTKVLKGKVTLPMIEEALKMTGIYVVTIWEGRPLCAQISENGKRLLLHAFKDGEPPAGSTITKFGSVSQFVQGQMRVFLELSCMVSNLKGKIFIKMEGEHEEVVVFRHFCLGDKGLSYANTCMAQTVINSKGIICGNRESRNGTEDIAARLTTTDFRWHESKRKRGTVEIHTADPTLFVIYTVVGKSDEQSVATVGCVEEGLSLVDAIRGLSNITDVTVTDCGLILRH